jgi:hypothetical protein
MHRQIFVGRGSRPATFVHHRAVGRRARVLGAVAASTIVVAGLASTAAAAATQPPDASPNFVFHMVNNDRDETFNQLLGINNSGTIAGYFGSGEKGHPNRGYVVRPPYAQDNFANENFPGAAQTQVVGINNTGDTVGFWVDGKGANHGFSALKGHTVKSVDFPTNQNAKPMVDQLLAVNDHDVAVGFYTDSKGADHGFSYDIARHRFRTVNVAGDANVTAAGINNEHDVAGFADNADGTTEGYLLRSDAKLYRLNVPGASATMAFGVNDGDEVVGAYTHGTGDTATTHGFVWAPGFGFQNVDDPHGVGATTLNGVNDRGTIVGFYTDSAGNTDGLLGKSSLGR